jgi:hypothetical protein
VVEEIVYMKITGATFINNVGFGRGGMDITEPESEPSFADWQMEQTTEEWRGRSIMSSLPDPGGCGQKLTEGSDDIVGPQSFTGKGNRK